METCIICREKEQNRLATEITSTERNSIGYADVQIKSARNGRRESLIKSRERTPTTRHQRYRKPPHAGKALWGPRTHRTSYSGGHKNVTEIQNMARYIPVAMMRPKCTILPGRTAPRAGQNTAYPALKYERKMHNEGGSEEPMFRFNLNATNKERTMGICMTCRGIDKRKDGRLRV